MAVSITVTDGIQRSESNVVDVSGVLTASDSETVSLASVAYFSGQWKSATILDWDPAYIWSPNGGSYNIPALVPSNPLASSLLWRVRGSYEETILPPLTVPGLWVWWDANQITGLNDGDTVDIWPDVSDNGRNLYQAGDPAGPQYKTNILNGLPVVRYTSTPFSYHETALFPLVTAPRTYFVVTYSNKANAYIMDGSVVGEYLEISYQITTGRLRTASPNAGNLVTNADKRGAWHYTTILSNNPGTSTIRCDGVHENNGNIGAQSHTGYVVGCHHGKVDSLGLEGDIAEILVYERLLDATDYGIIETYLADKYNI